MQRLLAGWIVVATTAIVVGSPPPRPTKREAWDQVLRLAWPDLETCSKQAGNLYGDVAFTLDAKTGRTTVSGSRSLGARKRSLEACVGAAFAKHLPLAGENSYEARFEHTHTIGTPRVILPAVATLMPVWRRVMAGGKDVAAARAQLAKLAPPDYTLTRHDCFTTTRQFAHSAELLWLPTTGTWVPKIWEKVVPKLVGYPVFIAMWDPANAFVVSGERGLCLVPFDAARQTVARREFDAHGACFTGGFVDVLTRPRVAFPTTKQYTAISSYAGRTCAVTTTSDVVCCGAITPPLPPAPRPVTSIALGHDFACGLDAAGAATCWGSIAAPAGTFRTIAAGHNHACGLRANGELACWGKHSQGLATPPPPKGAFVDTSSECGVRKDGTLECWDFDGVKRRPGAYSGLVLGYSSACGIRKDRTIGCGSGDGPVEIALPDRVKDAVVGVGYRVCGRRLDDTLACAAYPAQPGTTMVPVPQGKFRQLAADGAQYCGVREGGAIECWGTPWPATEPYPYAGIVTSPPPPTRLALAGRIVDEYGKPVAGAEVLTCSESDPCWSVARTAMTTPDKLADVIAKARFPSADTFAIATTDRDGKWQTSLAVRIKSYDDRIQVVAAAPGRVIAQREASPFDVRMLAQELVVGAAGVVDVEPVCDGGRCTGRLFLTLGTSYHYEHTHFERLPPGLYTFAGNLAGSQPGERIGKVTVDVPIGAKPQRVKLALARTGSGKSITGTAQLTSDQVKSIDKLRVTASCSGVSRDAITDASGRFELRDVGPPPCEVSFGLRGPYEVWSGTTSVKVDRVPATGVRLDAAVHYSNHR